MMAKQFQDTPKMFNLFNANDYIDFICDFVALLRQDIIIERFISESPANLLVAPKWNGIKNFEMVAKIEKQMAEKNIWQGKNYK